jgi:hypothetical protein
MASVASNHQPMAATWYLIHHVVLPPKLPQDDDYHADYERHLVESALNALHALQNSVNNPEAKNVVASGIMSLEYLRKSRDEHGNVSEQQLKEVFRKIAFDGTHSSFPLEIKAQNAGLIIRRSGQDVMFESFELSPFNYAAMSSEGRLIRAFPGSASRISLAIMQNEEFRDSLARTIARMTTQAAAGTQPRVCKDGQMVEEERDTTHPMMVTDWLMNYIASLGGTATSKQISKKTREEVLWNNCRLPWRRSPLWLLIRVSLQLLFTPEETLDTFPNGLYKAFMAQQICQILHMVRPTIPVCYHA